MSQIAIRAALEKAVKAVTPPLKTVLENDPTYVPVKGVPHQAVHVLFAEPANEESGAAYVERGFMQAMLLYPADGSGWGDAIEQAEAIRAAFPRSRAIQGAGVVVVVVRTPEIAPGQPDGDRYAVPVRIRFEAQVQG